MDKGYLIVSVYSENVSQPVSDATVRVIGETNYDKSFTTDINGKTNSIELDAPLKKYSLTPQKQVRPYSIYTIEVSKIGFDTVTINGVEVLPDETSLQNVFLKPSTASSTQFKTLALTSTGNVINLPPHGLWESGQSTTSRSYKNDDRIYPISLVPEYIIVHDGAPTSTNVANYYVSFPDYIKNAASGEIYSTWPIEAIRANVYAIVSFTLNRIFTEWYYSQGYNFTVTSLPAYDQSYVHNRTIFKTISDVVDQIFSNYIQLPNKNFPFLAQYDDGINTNNPGWLSQWGSKSLADQGYSALDILKYYYGSGIILNSAKEIEGLPTSFPGYNLKTGSCGEPVQKIQIMINTISGSYPAIPKIIPSDGRYMDNTANSIKIFQQVFNLPITGIVDFATWYKISYIYVAVTKMLKGVSA
jgi:peptidoglycan hydrolase-like protein with peptidoglycan-binding domain